MDRRKFNRQALLLSAGLVLGGQKVFAKTFLSAEQARQVMWPDLVMEAFEVTLTKSQMKSIKKASKTRVRSNILKGFKSKSGEYLIVDQVIGKHEFIDLAVGLDAQGQVKGIEILTYRESYGDEIMNPKWRDQFTGKGAEVLVLDEQIKNISGATMSCRHVTDGVNRLTATWQQVLQNV